MNIGRKLQIARSAITSITCHDDEDSTLLKAAINDLRAFLTSEEEALDARNAAVVAAQLAEAE